MTTMTTSANNNGGSMSKEMEKLINKSVKITDGMEVYFPVWKEFETEVVSEVAREHEGHFAYNNGVIAFVYKGDFYCTPLVGLAREVLNYSTGFVYKDFYVPLSNGEILRDANANWKWLALLEEKEKAS